MSEGAVVLLLKALPDDTLVGAHHVHALVDLQLVLGVVQDAWYCGLHDGVGH